MKRSLELIATEGYSAKETAHLNIYGRTVEFDKYRIMEELNVTSTAELVHYAIKHGIVSV